MNNEDINAINQMVSDHKMDIAHECYDLFLNSSDDLPHVFRNTDLTKQKERLVEGIETILRLFNQDSELQIYLQDLGVRHITYEVEDKHYPLIERALQGAFEKYAADYNIKMDWQVFAKTITDNMKHGAHKLRKAS